MVISSPASYQVHQRASSNTARVPVRAEAAAGPARVEVRVMPGAGDDPVTAWTALDRGDGYYAGELTIPAGGWYRLEARALGDDGSVIDDAVVEKFGVGEVFICAGQSNAANSGSVPLRSEDDRVAGFDGRKWSHCDDPQRGASGEGGSPWPVLGDLLAANLDVPVAFASVAEGGSSVNWWQPGTEGYTRIKTVARSLGTDGARAVLWHQGETDAVNAMPAADYERSLTNIVNRLKQDSGYDLQWFVAKVSFVPDGFDASSHNQEAIRSAQQSLWDKGVARQGPDTDTLSAPKYRADDLLHFSELGLRRHAQRWFALLWTQLFERPH